MRQIKFRAWWVEEKKMLHNAQNFYDGLNRRDNGNEYEPVQSFAEILESPDSYIAMQFTGLLDREGVEIYEGDILVFADWATKPRPQFVMSWCDEVAGFTPYGPKKDYKVIGNIHQHPELLK